VPWVSPALVCKFGPYFKTDADEQTKQITMIQQALGKGIVGGGEQLIPKRTAIEKLAPIFGLENIDAIEDALEEEQAEAEQKEADAAAADQKLQTQHSVAVAKASPAPVAAPAPKPVPK
jgi:hypothetical protein